MEKMKRALLEASKLAEKNEVELSLVIKNLTTGESTCFNDEKIHSSASLIKIPIMMAVLEDHDLESHIRLEEVNRVPFSVVTEIGEEFYSLDEYLRWMMIESCNASTNVLIDLVGMDRVNKIFRELGMAESVLARKMMDLEARKKGFDNFTSARDMARLMEILYKREYFSTLSCERALEIMSSCRSFNLLPRHVARLPIFAHKTGGLGEVSHDVGIFFGQEDLLVSALSTNISNEENDPKRVQVLARLGRELFK